MSTIYIDCGEVYARHIIHARFAHHPAFPLHHHPSHPRHHLGHCHHHRIGHHIHKLCPAPMTAGGGGMAWTSDATSGAWLGLDLPSPFASIPGGVEAIPPWNRSLTIIPGTPIPPAGSIPTAIPEPTTWLLLLLGLFFVGRMISTSTSNSPAPMAPSTASPSPSTIGPKP